MKTLRWREVFIGFIYCWLAVSVAEQAYAANYTWSGGSTGMWSSSSNWSGTAPPSTDTTAILTFPSAGIYSSSLNNNYSSFILTQLFFDSGTPVVQVTGGTLAFSSTGSNIGVNQSSANPVTIANPLTWSGTGTFGFDSTGLGGIDVTTGLTASGSNSIVDVNAGLLTLMSSATIATGPNGNFRVGDSAPGSLTIENSASVSVHNELDVNYGSTRGSESTLTLISGTLTTNGPTMIGRASMRTDPSTTNATYFQSGGSATLAGLVTVGNVGTATSFFNINGGTANALAGMVVGNLGDASASIQGSAQVSVSSTAGLIIGEDSSLATSGSLNLSGGTLKVAGNLVLGQNGGMGSFSRTGGALSIGGSLSIQGASTLTLDGRSGSIATSFGGTLIHSSPGTLVVVPYGGDLGNTESVEFASTPSLTNGILGSWAVRQNSGTDSTGDFLTISTTGGVTRLATASYTSGFTGSSGTSIINVTGSQTIGNTSAYAIKFSGTSTTNLSAALNVGSNSTPGGLIFNGGAVNGGNINFSNALGTIYAGSTTSGTIGSSIATSSGIVKFGPGTLILNGDSSQSGAQLNGGVNIEAGTVVVANTGALGVGSSSDPTTVASGASLQLQAATISSPLTLNGGGVSGSGALQSFQNAALNTALTLGSNAQINTSTGTLTLSAPLIGNAYTLTKSGTGTLALSSSSDSAFPGYVTISNGVLSVTNSGALDTFSSSIGLTIQNGATLAMRTGLANSSVSLTAGGTGFGNDGAISLHGNNSFAGQISMSADTQIDVDAASDSFSLTGVISGAFNLTKAGSGSLQLTGSNTFTGGLTALAGTLSVPSLNVSGTSGALGAGTAPVTLGSNGATTTFEYTGASSASTNRNLTLASGGAGFIQIDQAGVNVDLTGVIGGNGNLIKGGPGLLTLSGSNTFTGTTTVSAGTLAIDANGSINASSGIVLGSGMTLQVTAGTLGVNQLPNAGNMTMNGGSLSFVANSAMGSGGELAGALLLGPGQNNITLTNSGSNQPYLRFASGPITHVVGSVVVYSASNSQIQFQANAPTLVNGILGGYSYWGSGSNTSFATLALVDSTANTYAVQPFTSSAGDVGALTSSASLNVTTAGTPQSSLTSSKAFNSLILTGTNSVSMTGGGTLTLTTGGLITNTTGAVTGGTLLGSASGELTVNTIQNASISSVIANNASATALVKTGTATLSLLGVNSYTGDTWVDQGLLVLSPSSNTTYTGVIRGVGNITKSGTSIENLTSAIALTGVTSVSQGILRFNVPGNAALVSNLVLQGGTLDLASSGSIGSLTITPSSGSWEETGSVTGAVNMTGGTLTLLNSIYAGKLNANGGIYSTAASAISGGSLSVSSGTNLAVNTAQPLTVGSVISDGSTATSLTKTGTSRLTLTATNTFSGGTSLTGGTLQLASSASLGSGPLTISGGVLDLNGLHSLAIGSLSGTGGSISSSQSANSTLKLDASSGGAVSTYSGMILNGSGTLSVEMVGSGIAALAGTNSYTGGTYVATGTLELLGASSLLAGSHLTIGAGNGAGAVFTSPDTVATSPILTAPVPEPGSLPLLIAGVFVLYFVAMRKGMGAYHVKQE